MVIIAKSRQYPTNLLIRENAIKFIAVLFVLYRVLDGLFKLSSELFGITIKVCLKASFNLKVVVVIVNVDVMDILQAGARKHNRDFALQLFPRLVNGG